MNGASSKSFFGVNPGHNGETIKLRISINPIWLLTTIAALPGPLLGTRLFVVPNFPFSESADTNELVV